jgi:hypothetical protein
MRWQFPREGDEHLDSRNSEYLQKEGFYCDNRLRSDKPRHVYCRTFESAEHWLNVFLVSTSALVVRADLRYRFEVKVCESVFLAFLYPDI